MLQKDEEKVQKDEKKARRAAESRGAGRRKQKALNTNDAETTSTACNERNNQSNARDRSSYTKSTTVNTGRWSDTTKRNTDEG